MEEWIPLQLRISFGHSHCTSQRNILFLVHAEVQIDSRKWASCYSLNKIIRGPLEQLCPTNVFELAGLLREDGLDMVFNKNVALLPCLRTAWLEWALHSHLTQSCSDFRRNSLIDKFMTFTNDYSTITMKTISTLGKDMERDVALLRYFYGLFDSLNRPLRTGGGYILIPRNHKGQGAEIIFVWQIGNGQYEVEKHPSRVLSSSFHWFTRG